MIRNYDLSNYWVLNIQIYSQHDATLHSLFISGKLLYMFRVGISTHHQEHTHKLYLQHQALVRPLLLPASIVEEFELRFQLFHDSGR